MEKSFWLSAVRLLIVLAAIGLLFIALYFTLPLIYPFLLGFLLAYIFNPVVNWLEEKARFPRWLSVILIIVIVLAFIVTVVTLAVIGTASEINKVQYHLQENVDEYIRQVESFIIEDVVSFYDQFTRFFSSLDPEMQRNIENYVEQISSRFVEMVSEAVTTFLNGVLAFLSAIPIIATAFVFALLASFFISKDWYKWRKIFINIVPEPVLHSGGAVIRDLKQALFGFIKAQLTLISITFIIILTGLMIMRIEYALTIALIASLIDLLPYLGTGLVFIPWIIYSFISGQYGMVIGLSILYGLVLIQRQMMEPKILGDNVGLDPLTTLFALFVGFQLFGVVGLIVGPVLMVILFAVHRAGVFREIWTFVKGT